MRRSVSGRNALDVENINSQTIFSFQKIKLLKTIFIQFARNAAIKRIKKID
jgi:hypothetical protein